MAYAQIQVEVDLDQLIENFDVSDILCELSNSDIIEYIVEDSPNQMIAALRDSGELPENAGIFFEIEEKTVMLQALDIYVAIQKATGTVIMTESEISILREKLI
jgi:hypothetical protein